MKKIAFILGSMGRGGAERVISILSREYAKRGYQTDIIVLLSNELGYELHSTTQLIDFSGNTKSRWKRFPYWLKSIRSYVKINKPDVVVSFAARINVLVMTACFGLKKKIILSERNDPKCDGRSKLVDILTKIQYKKAYRVIFQTKRACSYFPKLKNSVIIPNPITVACYANNTNVNKLVNVGRLTKQKNQEMLIDAFAKISKKNRNAFLEIYGSGELENPLKEKIEQYGLIDKVYLMGNVSNIHERIADAVGFCLSSDYEGLSNALLEAMMMGLPCISTNCAGADEYIIDGENGFLVSVGDKECFSVAMDKLLNDSLVQKQFSTKARECSKVFSLENVIQQWDDVILK